MIEKKTWTEFREIGLLWFINTILHTFGWAIVVKLDDDNNFVECYPARVSFRGFTETSNTKGYQRVSQYMKDNIETIYKETMED